jgi:hypothetical protein
LGQPIDPHVRALWLRQWIFMPFFQAITI